MKLKKIAIYLLAGLISLTALPLMSNAAKLTPGITTDATSAEAKGNSAVELRLNEIKNMDKSLMSSFEKKELRKELRTMKREQRRDSRGVYISVGAAIIIILLLILIL